MWRCGPALLHQKPKTLAVINGTRNCAADQSTLKENVRPSFGDLKKKPTWVLLQENDPKHTKSCQTWLSESYWDIVGWFLKGSSCWKTQQCGWIRTFLQRWVAWIPFSWKKKTHCNLLQTPDWGRCFKNWPNQQQLDRQCCCCQFRK